MSAEDRKIHHDASRTLQKHDVFGDTDENYRRISDGLVVARSDKTCPIWGDKVPSKSVTVVCNVDQESDVAHWLAYVHGGGWSMRLKLDDGRIAIRSDYQAW